jgi:ribonuclease P protein component
MNRLYTYHRENRVRKKTEFDYLFRNGKKTYSSYYISYHLPSNVSRLGLSIAKRFGNAVFRNRQKRVIREFFRKEKIDFISGFDIVIILWKIPPNSGLQQQDLIRLFQCLTALKK